MTRRLSLKFSMSDPIESDCEVRPGLERQSLSLVFPSSPVSDPSPPAKLVLIGGTSDLDQKECHDLHCYDISSSSWSKLSPSGEKPQICNWHSVASSGNKLFIFGGFEKVNKVCTNELYVLHFVEDEQIWEKINTTGTRPAPRRGHSMVVKNDSLICMFGENGTIFFDDVWSLDLKQHSLIDSDDNYTSNIRNRRDKSFEWKKLVTTGDVLSPCAYSSVALRRDNTIFLHGGILHKNQKYYLDGIYTLSQNSDDSNWKWQKVPQISFSRQRHCSAFLNSRLLICGGKPKNCNNSTLSVLETDNGNYEWFDYYSPKDFKYVDSDRENWLANSNEVQNAAAAVYEDTVYIFGGLSFKPSINEYLIKVKDSPCKSSEESNNEPGNIDSENVQGLTQKGSNPPNAQTTQDLNSFPDPQSLFLYTFGSIREMIKPENRIGKGGNGEVYKAMINDLEVAIKRLKDEHVDNKEHVKQLEKELSILIHIMHKNVVQLYGYCIENECYLVLQYCSLGDLHDLIHNNNSNLALSWEKRVEIIRGIAEGLKYLHIDCGYTVIHCDIKLKNILLDKDWVPKLADFGLASQRKPEHTMTTDKIDKPGFATLEYIAPEFWNKKSGSINRAVDIYAFGICILEIITGQQAVGNFTSIIEQKITQNCSIKEICKDEFICEGSKEEFIMLLKIGRDCTKFKSEERPPIDEVCELLSKSYIDRIKNHPQNQFDQSSVNEMLKYIESIIRETT